MVNGGKNSITKYAVLVVALLVLLITGLNQSPFSVYPIFAEPPDPCFGDDCPGSRCFNNPGSAQCCWTGPNGDEICQSCDVSESGDYENCTPPSTKGIPGSNVIAPPPAGVAPPPSTKTCPENTALDAKGNCAPITQSPKEPPAGVDCTKNPDDPLCKPVGINPPPSSTDDNNKPAKPKLPKGDDVLSSPSTDQGAK
jgi:hypothetical protein